MAMLTMLMMLPLPPEGRRLVVGVFHVVAVAAVCLGLR
jgi:hypothetical protein